MEANPTYTLLSFLVHKIAAQGRHGTHSPFVYGLVDQVINRQSSYQNKAIEKKLTELKNNQELIEITDFKTGISKQKTIRSIAQKSTSSTKFRAFMAGLIEYMNITRVLETGTSLGITTSYLASSPSNPLVHSIEGNPALAKLAKSLWEDKKNITFTEGNIYDCFEDVLNKSKPEMVFLDADHRSEAIQFYFQKLNPLLSSIKVIVIHDIYWSRDMNKAWQQIKSRNDIPLTIDIFQAGLIFPNINMPKQHFRLIF